MFIERAINSTPVTPYQMQIRPYFKKNQVNETGVKLVTTKKMTSAF